MSVPRTRGPCNDVMTMSVASLPSSVSCESSSEVQDDAGDHAFSSMVGRALFSGIVALIFRAHNALRVDGCV